MAHRIKRCPHLDSKLLVSILRILDNNPYVRVFRSLGQMHRLDEFKIELNTSISVDQRRYNAPAMEQVAAIWEDGTDEKQKFTRSIMVYPNSGHPHFIRAYYECYDTLAYPILYPGGETAGKVKVYYLNKILLYVSLERKGATLKGNVNVLAPLIFFHVTLLIFYKYEMALII